nr:MAG TPA: Blasticidin M [Caudoviricetes sp.]
MNKKLVYVAHPFGGKESNRKKIDVIMGDLVLHDLEHDYVSPIHNYGYVYLTGDDYQKGLDICLGLLSHCDILVLCPEWQSSRGCKGEFEYAQKHGKAIFTLEEWKAMNHI